MPEIFNVVNIAKKTTECSKTICSLITPRIRQRAIEMQILWIHVCYPKTNSFLSICHHQHPHDFEIIILGKWTKRLYHEDNEIRIKLSKYNGHIVANRRCHICPLVDWYDEVIQYYAYNKYSYNNKP